MTLGYLMLICLGASIGAFIVGIVVDLIRHPLSCGSATAATAPPPSPGPVTESQLFQETPHRRDCAWCGVVILAGREPVSHGICPQCLSEQKNAASKN